MEILIDCPYKTTTYRGIDAGVPDGMARGAAGVDRVTHSLAVRAAGGCEPASAAVAVVASVPEGDGEALVATPVHITGIRDITRGHRYFCRVAHPGLPLRA
jgi:hypothetical protein